MIGNGICTAFPLTKTNNTQLFYCNQYGVYDSVQMRADVSYDLSEIFYYILLSDIFYVKG